MREFPALVTSGIVERARRTAACYLQDLYVVPPAPGGGIGRVLIEAVYGAADSAGAAQVYWLTQDFNATAAGSMTGSRR